MSALGQVGTTRSVDALEDAYECLTTEVSSSRRLTSTHEGFLALRIPILILFGTSNLRPGSLIGQFSLGVYAILQLALHAALLGLWRRHASGRGRIAVEVLKSITQILDREARTPSADTLRALRELSCEMVRQRLSTRRTAQGILSRTSRKQRTIDSRPRVGSRDLNSRRNDLPVPGMSSAGSATSGRLDNEDSRRC